MLVALALAQLLRICASNVDVRTMAAIVRVESGGKVYALHDNTLRRSFAPSGSAEAVGWAEQLIALGHSVDIGLSQVNSANLPGLGLSVEAAFQPCTNVRAGASILGADYAAAVRQFGPGQFALRRALAAYNTGSFFAGQEYINQILVAAGMPTEAGPTAPAPASPVARAPHLDYTTQHVAGSPVEVILGH